MGIKILFIYPNTYGMNMLPPAIALFSALLKREGHEVDLFDATYYQTDYGVNSDGTKETRLNVVPFKANDLGITMRTSDWREDLRKNFETFQPDLIALSSTEDMWQLGMYLLESAKDCITRNRIPVIAGGVFPTFAPLLALAHEMVDMVCVGEGEGAMIELCSRIEKGRAWDDVENLWTKQKDGSIRKNPIAAPYDVDDAPVLDMSLFEPARLYRPMAGKWYRMTPVETIRGCPYKCSFCNSPDQMDLYDAQTNSSFFRKKRIELVYRDLKYFKDEWGVEYNYFWADTFLAWNESEFEEFCDMYSEIGLPFWMQTRPETISDYKIKRLAKVGLHRISFGVEHGNSNLRLKLLKRDWKNEPIVEALKIPHRHGVAFSVNNITGFPTETREMAMDTVELNVRIESDNQNMYAFVPFHGTPLRKLCEDQGLIEPGALTRALTDRPVLDMPQYPREEVEGLIKCFALYVKFPKSRWKDIRRAEANDPEGEKIFEELRREYLDKYLPTPKPDREIPATADLEYGLENAN